VRTISPLDDESDVCRPHPGHGPWGRNGDFVAIGEIQVEQVALDDAEPCPWSVSFFCRSRIESRDGSAVLLPRWRRRLSKCAKEALSFLCGVRVLSESVRLSRGRDRFERDETSL
jgi:hypothetical protein